MGCPHSVRLLFCIFVSSLPFPTWSTNENDNAPEFNFLCHVAGLLLNTAEVKKLQPPTVEPIEQARERAELVNITLSDEEFFSNGGGTPQGTDKDAAVGGDRKRWEELKKKLTEKAEKGGLDIKRSSVYGGAFARRAKLIVEKLERLRLKAVEERENFERSRDAAVEHMKQALFGVKANINTTTALDSSFQTNYAAGCGGTAGQETVGKSLASDILCLCGVDNTRISNTAANGAKRCANSALVFVDSQHGYDDASGHPKAIAAWGLIEAECRKRAMGAPTPENLAAGVSAFPALIGRHRHDSNGVTFHSYVLGSHVTDNNGCVGSAVTGTCVNYKHQLSDANKKIEWVAKIQEAINDLKQMKTAEIAIGRETEAAQHLEQAAIDLFLSTEVSSFTDSGSGGSQPSSVPPGVKLQGTPESLPMRGETSSAIRPATVKNFHLNLAILVVLTS